MGDTAAAASGRVGGSGGERGAGGLVQVRALRLWSKLSLLLCRTASRLLRSRVRRWAAGARTTAPAEMASAGPQHPGFQRLSCGPSPRRDPAADLLSRTINREEIWMEDGMSPNAVKIR